MKGINEYSFITTWKIKAPIQKVWNTIYDTENWPQWWKPVKRAVLVEKGNDNDIGMIMEYTWRSLLPYSLTFRMISQKIEAPFYLEGEAFGELNGYGKWLLSEKEDITTLQCEWNVTPGQKWMTLLTPIIKPIFKWNHNVAMKQGAKGLAQLLNAQLLEY